jgi:hypothetical protein
MIIRIINHKFRAQKVARALRYIKNNPDKLTPVFRDKHQEIRDKIEVDNKYRKENNGN